ncbi:uncharacterized protein LOC131244026 [Magnolia sinica]|uniref:uncharacterized protein LOC131244026 n=1 Tax=Magnolia sinica TaxID=86752 RepID=UPI0026594D69|nr:uncharacterized protein LOC131244026 [Magnolia sinica]
MTWRIFLMAFKARGVFVVTSMPSLQLQKEGAGEPLTDTVLENSVMRLRTPLKSWNKEHFGDIFERLKAAETKVAALDLQLQLSNSSQGNDMNLHLKFQEASEQLNQWETKHEIFWKQKSRVLSRRRWLFPCSPTTSMIICTSTDSASQQVQIILFGPSLLQKILHNAIPVEKTIQSKGVSLASKCGCYRDDSEQGLAEESVSHLFLNGQQASSVWDFFGVQARISIMQATTVEARIRQWRRACADSRGMLVSKLLTLTFILWELWKSRNGTFYDEKAITIQSVIAKVSWWLNTTRTVDIKRRYVQLHPPQQSVVLWQKPPVGWVKVNVDGSSRGNPGFAGGGGICRNDKGEFIFGFAFGYSVILNIGAVVCAAHDGLLLCLEKGFSKIVVESDSDLVIKVFNKGANIGWQWNGWRVKTNSLRDLTLVEFKHVFKEGNASADALTCKGSVSRAHFFTSSRADLPQQVRGLLFLDKVGLGAIRERKI